METAGRDERGVVAEIGCGGALLGAVVLCVPGVIAAAQVLDQMTGSEQVDLLDDALLTLVVWWVLLPGTFLALRSGDLGRTALAVAGAALVAGVLTAWITAAGV